MTLPFYKRVDS